VEILSGSVLFISTIENPEESGLATVIFVTSKFCRDGTLKNEILSSNMPPGFNANLDGKEFAEKRVSDGLGGLMFENKISWFIPVMFTSCDCVGK